MVIEQAIPQGAVRIVDEHRGLQVALRRSIALKKQARWECENDMGGRFKKALPRFTMPFPSIFRVLLGLRLHGRTGNARLEISGADGSDLFEALVQEWDGVVFHKPRTAPWGSLPSNMSPREGRRTN